MESTKKKKKIIEFFLKMFYRTLIGFMHNIGQIFGFGLEKSLKLSIRKQKLHLSNQQLQVLTSKYYF